MSAAKHTRGPWQVEDLGANGLTIKATGGVHVEAGAKAETRDYYQRIGSVTQRDPHPSFAGGIPREVTVANARLIVAAPDMADDLASIVRLCLTPTTPTQAVDILGQIRVIAATSHERAIGGAL